MHALVKSEIPEAVVLLREKNYGFGHSNNRAVQEVDAKYLFFLNPDTVLVEEDVLDRLYAFMEERPQTGILAPRICHFSGELQETCRRFPVWYMPLVQRTRFAKTTLGSRYAEKFLMRDVNHDKLRMIDWAQGSALMMSKDFFEELQGFDDQFWMYFEDIDLCRRSWEKGRPVYYHGGITLHHAYGKASDAPGGIVKNVLTNRAAREHIKSWLKYMWKWRK